MHGGSHSSHLSDLLAVGKFPVALFWAVSDGRITHQIKGLSIGKPGVCGVEHAFANLNDL